MKRTLLVSIALGGLLLAGAGCASDDTTPTATTPTGTETTVTTPAVDATGTTKENDFKLTATSDNHGQVSMKWTSLGDKPTGVTQRILHSAKPNIELPGRAFWQELTADKTSFVWEGVPSGVRYFRACIFQSGKCTAYSNEVELNVK